MTYILSFILKATLTLRPVTDVYTPLTAHVSIMTDPESIPLHENTALLVLSDTPPAECTEGEQVALLPDQEITITTRYQFLQQACICTLWCISAVIMTVLNKIVLELVPVGSAVLLVQITICVMLLKLYNLKLTIHPPTAWDLLPCAMLFCVNLYTSMQAISLLSIPTFNMIRNMQCFISCPLDYVVRGEKVSCSSFCAMLIVLLGSVLYCGHSDTVDAIGLVWATVNTAGVCAYTIYIKIKFKNVGPTEIAWYNNITSLLPIAIMTVYDTLFHLKPRESVMACAESGKCAGFLALSSVGCCAITITTFHSQQIMSPTTWLLFNNLNKIPSTVMACIIWSIPLGWLEITGLVTSLIGGLIYSFTRI